MHNFATINNAFQNAGIELSTAGYSYTGYSLNTALSFKFENIDEFIAFLSLDATTDTTKKEHVMVMLADAGLDPNNFFYVNFYLPKVAEL